MNVTIEQYQKKYGIQFLSNATQKSLLKESGTKEQLLSSIIENLPTKTKRQVFLKRVGQRAQRWESFANPIYMPIKRRWSGSREEWIYYVNDDMLFLGGVASRIFMRHSLYSESNCLVIPDTLHSIYIGDMPTWVKERYKQSSVVFGEKNIFVVSRHRELFNIIEYEPIIRVGLKLSPLLVAISEDSSLYLQAAWGLEHELPKSLGGLLLE